MIPYYYTIPGKLALNAAVDEMAEHLSRDRLTLNEIADEMEITRGSACVIYRELCDRYGEVA
jgi:predicted DNA-binding protein YlxM (UPF0122 family)